MMMEYYNQQDIHSVKKC